jgi:hypothetical protein
MTSHRRFWNWESRNRISFGQEQNSYVYYKHDHDAPERPYHLKEYSPTFHFHEDDRYAPMTLEQFQRQYEMSMRIYRCLIVSTPKNYTMYTNKRTVTLDESCTSIYCTWCCTLTTMAPWCSDQDWRSCGRPGTRPYSGERRYRTYRPCLFRRTQWRLLEKHRRMSRRRWIGPGLLGEVLMPTIQVRNGGYLVLKDVTSDGVAWNRPSSYKHRYWRKYR